MAFQKLTALSFHSWLGDKEIHKGIEFCLQGQEVGVCQAYPACPSPTDSPPCWLGPQGDAGWGLGSGGRQAGIRLGQGWDPSDVGSFYMNVQICVRAIMYVGEAVQACVYDSIRSRD